jgi:very-short-patch-repair endonuclease
MQDASGIADAICAYLKEQGYETQKNVGHSEYKLDIGVVDLKNPEQYKLGIMLDGRTYGTAKTARDREIAQIGVLNGLGWRLLRVWCMDWWDNPQSELERIMKALTEPDPESQEEEPIPTSDTKLAAPVVKPAKEPTNPAINYYTPANLKLNAVTAEDLLLPRYAAGIRNKMQAVIAAEAPICKTLLMRRVVQSYGITRMGTRIQAHLDTIISRINPTITENDDQSVIWAPGQDPDSYSTFRQSKTEDDRRDAKEIPIPEATAAVCQALGDQISLNQDDLIRESAKLLGYTRLGTSVNTLFTAAIRYAAWKGKILEGINGNWTTA